MGLAQFQVTGSALFMQGLVTSNLGNLSVRMGDRIIITRRGSSLSHLEEQDLIETGIFKNDRNTPLASVELPVHRAIYQQTPASAIVHAHLPHATALSLVTSEIVPSDEDSLNMIGRVPVIGFQREIDPVTFADEIAASLVEHKVVMVYGHGSYARGQLLEEALDYTTGLESGARVNVLLNSLQQAPAPAQEA